MNAPRAPIVRFVKANRKSVSFISCCFPLISTHEILNCCSYENLACEHDLTEDSHSRMIMFQLLVHYLSPSCVVFQTLNQSSQKQKRLDSFETKPASSMYLERITRSKCWWSKLPKIHFVTLSLLVLMCEMIVLLT